MKILIKILSFLIGCFIIFIIAISSNSKWFEIFTKYTPNPYRNGDLFLYSNMPGYKTNLNRSIIKTYNKLQNNNISLTIIGDSYMRDFNSTSFCVNAYNFIHWDNIPHSITRLDNKKTNILIIETTERYCRWRLKNSNPLYINENSNKVIDSIKIKLSAEDNIQYIVTNLDFLLPFKELKAYIYLNIFDKFDERVTKPNEKGRLYLKETIDPENNSSCYNKISENEIDEIVNYINTTYKNAKKIGFNKVYFSIIPNAASLYNQSELPYNHIIERIQRNPNLKVSYINAYKILRKQTKSVFYYNDSHWNRFGQILWLTHINELLKTVKGERNN